MVNFLSKLIHSDLLKRSDDVVGVDIGSSAIKIVQIKKEAGELVLGNYGSLALGPYANVEVGQATGLSKGKIVEAFDVLLRETGISVKEAAIAIPMKSAMFAVVEMPALKQKQLDEIIPMEARKYIPVPIEEVALDYWVIPARLSDGDAQKRKKVNVLIAAIHKETLNRHQEIKSELGFLGNTFEIEIFSTIRSVVGPETQAVAVIDIGASATKVALIEYGTVRNTYLINKGSQDATLILSKSLSLSIAEAEEWKRHPERVNRNNASNVSRIVELAFAGIFSDVERVLSDYQKKYNTIIGKVILSGGGALSEKVRTLATTTLKKEIVVGDPFSRVQTPNTLQATLREIGPEFAVAVGVALSVLEA